LFKIKRRARRKNIRIRKTAKEVREAERKYSIYVKKKRKPGIKKRMKIRISS
jgi:hypothetical protein